MALADLGWMGAIASASVDKTVRIWAVKRGEERCEAILCASGGAGGASAMGGGGGGGGGGSGGPGPSVPSSATPSVMFPSVPLPPSAFCFPSSSPRPPLFVFGGHTASVGGLCVLDDGCLISCFFS